MDANASVLFVPQAFLYTKCRRIIGVELNEDLCQLQRSIIAKHNFQVSSKK